MALPQKTVQRPSQRPLQRLLVYTIVLVYRDCWFLWHFHRDRTETVIETVTETVGFCGMIHRDRPNYKVTFEPTSVILTVSVDHPTKTNGLCNSLCDGLCTVSVDCTIKTNSLCAQKVHALRWGVCSP